VTQHIKTIGNESLDNRLFFLHDRTEGAGKATAEAWHHSFPPQPLGNLGSYLASAPTEAGTYTRSRFRPI
jgi:hypothetical protein